MSNYSKRSSNRRSDDTMDDDAGDKDDTKRKSRNLSEKKRRDQFNLLVNELSSMVSTGSRKMDKSAVLKATISFLKNHQEVVVRSRAHDIQEEWKPSFLSNEEFTHLILEALDGFIAVFSASGQVHYVSESVTALLGYLPNEFLTMSLYDLIYEEDASSVYGAISGAVGQSQNAGDQHISFSAHIRRAEINYQPPNTHELVHFLGYIRTDVEKLETDNTRFSGYSGEADTRLFVGTGRLQTPQLIREMSIVDNSKSEFTSRHSLEWKFLFLDHRAPPIIGYLPFEVLGTSGYDYYHVDDLDKVVNCHEALMKKGEGTSCYYRFLTKGQQWIWLQTRFYITYHQWNSKPEFIVCTHRVVSYIDVMKNHRKLDSTSISDPMTVEVDDISPAPTSVATPGSGTSSPWAPHRDKGHFRPGPPSDRTSMSADSPGSRQSSVLTPLHSSVKLERKISQQNQEVNQNQQQIQNQQPQYVKTQQQYVAAIPVQPVIASFPAPAVLSPLPPHVDNMVIQSNAQNNNLQAQLQRKHAELQALIGQQQAELRRVSEQLLMAKLGLLPSSQPTSTVLNVAVPYVSNSNNVSSTTTSVSVASGAVSVPVTVNVPVVGAEILAPVAPQSLDESSAMALSQQQAQMLFAAPSSNSLNPQR